MIVEFPADPQLHRLLAQLHKAQDEAREVGRAVSTLVSLHRRAQESVRERSLEIDEYLQGLRQANEPR